MWTQIEQAVFCDRRLTSQEGLFLLSEDAPLLELGALAQAAREKKTNPAHVTFVVDSNPNYTNICDTDCLFCAFYRRPKDKDAYALTVDQVMEKVGNAVNQGATTILLQGGHNRALPLSYYTDIVREMKKRFPNVTPHCFTASEVQTMAQVAGITIEEVLTALWEAGQRTLPGVGGGPVGPSAAETGPQKGRGGKMAGSPPGGP
jgi:cyclic dehypoxanthinyl futalosine synthase